MAHLRLKFRATKLCLFTVIGVIPDSVLCLPPKKCYKPGTIETDLRKPINLKTPTFWSEMNKSISNSVEPFNVLAFCAARNKTCIAADLAVFFALNLPAIDSNKSQAFPEGKDHMCQVLPCIQSRICQKEQRDHFRDGARAP